MGNSASYLELLRGDCLAAHWDQLKRFLFSQRMFLVVVLTPTVAFYLIFAYLPIVGSIAMSFSNVDTFLIIQGARLVGGENYREAFEDPLTWLSLKNTFVFATITVPARVALALAVAMLLNSIRRGRSLFRTLYFIPVITSMVAVSILWKWLYQPRFGLLNVLIDMIKTPLGLNLPTIRWLEDPAWALLSIAIMSIWKDLGFTAVLFLAGLSGIPSEYYEAARIDGAGRWELFSKITLPLLQPTMVFVLVTGTIGTLQVFTQMYVMTQGGPLYATYTIVYLIYDKAFREFLGGYTSALACILFVIILVISLLQLKIYKTTWEY